MSGVMAEIPIEFFPAFEAASWLKARSAQLEVRLVLDVGCGDGGLGYFLQGEGCVVHGIDRDEQLAGVAAERGIKAVQADWFDYEPENQHDLIIFSRVLHHMKPVDVAIKKAYAHLKIGGSIFIDDFAFAQVDANTARWFHSFLKSLEGQRQAIIQSKSFASEIFRADGNMAVWKKDYVRNLNTAEQIEEACEGHFDLKEAVKVPYLYRYLSQALAGTDCHYNMAVEARNSEFEAGRMGEIELIGRRYIGQKVE